MGVPVTRQNGATPGRRGADWAGAALRVRPDSGSVLIAPVSAAPALFATIRARPGPFRHVKTASSGAWRRF